MSIQALLRADLATMTPESAVTALDAADAALRRIPPLWPLDATVAVNPFLGYAGEGLAETAARIARAHGERPFAPRALRLAQVASGEIARADLEAALAAAPSAARLQSVEALIAALEAPAPEAQAAPTLADLAAARDGIDWPALIADRVGAWAAARWDAGQALWPAPKAASCWASWRGWAARDLTPEIAGLRGFCALVAEAPDTAPAALARALRDLDVPEAAMPAYLHRLAADLGGWGQWARGVQWRAERDGGTDDAPLVLVTARLMFEDSLLACGGASLALDWAAALADLAAPVSPSQDDLIDAIAQDAAERAARRRIEATLAEPVAAAEKGRCAIQAAFCIDVRSEPFRRAFEASSPKVRTLGFAGFFGVGVAHRGCASDVAEPRLPVLLKPGLTSRSPAADDAQRRILARSARAWGRFKQAAVSSFAFVEAAGPLHAVKLAAEALGLKGARAPDPAPQLDPPLPLAARVGAGETILKAMSLTSGFARLALIVGHGSEVANNAMASAYACGACGGYSGEVNARLLASLLNDVDVREGLRARGIDIPDDTLFVGGLHDTASDVATLFDADVAAAAHQTDLAEARRLLAEAGARARAERALRLPGAPDPETTPARARDWSQIRPEWGLAGCMAFIAAPRARTEGRDLGGRAFLHDYDWRDDVGFGVLELIVTAPVVVASWISLQYYGSATAPRSFGAGDKLLHNVVGGIGVLEGAGGLIRGGLPWQAVHDGEKLMHDPLRLSVLIEAPTEALDDILARHGDVAALFDNGWLALGAMDAEGRVRWRGCGGGWRAPEAVAAL
ncbi:YbcC family protein [Rubrimonas sp.]|uniref:YbcC family protein n=1 Tax=Rubrimonas sp. TaxID=2036015 RepID=UPI002FDEB297